MSRPVTGKPHAQTVIRMLDRVGLERLRNSTALARNVPFISGLLESGVDFVAADNPHANKLMVHLLAAFAEHEREQISQRTKDVVCGRTFSAIAGMRVSEIEAIRRTMFGIAAAPTWGDLGEAERLCLTDRTDVRCIP
jgi:resolvase-like protein